MRWDYVKHTPRILLEAVSKPQIASKYKARVDEKIQHKWACENFDKARNAVSGR
jgi:hypothetical protein